MRKDLFQIAAEKSIDELSSDIKNLKNKTFDSSTMTKESYDKLIAELEVKRQELIECYNQVSDARDGDIEIAINAFKKLNNELHKSIGNILS